MEASGSPFEKSHRAGAAERAGVAVRNAGQESGKERGRRAAGIGLARCAKLSKFPQAFPDAGTRAAERANSVFVRGRAQKRVRAGGSVGRSGLPGIDRGWGAIGGNGVLPKAQDFGLARCARAG